MTAQIARIGFIGLGIMGGPMAGRLAAAGFEVTGYNRSAAAVDRLVAAGGKAGESIAEVTRSADVVITMLPDSPDVEAVVLGEGGVMDSARRGLLYIDMSTVKPRTAVTIALAAGVEGIRPVDAPVSGGEHGAVDGTLSIMCGGAADDIDAARPVLENLGTTIVRVGPSGAGQTVKAANQMVVAGILEMVAEAMVLMEACDVDVEAGMRVLAGGLAGSRVLDRKGAEMLARSFAPGFRVDLHHKDLKIGLDVADSVGVATPAAAVVAQMMAALRAQGDGALDHTALVRVVERMSGRCHDRD